MGDDEGRPPVPVRSDALSGTFAALADPTRRAMLARLAQGEATVAELRAPFAMTAPAITKHLRVLERAGLIERGRHAQWRPCRLRPEPLRDVAEWVEQYRARWEESYARLDEVLAELQRLEAQAESPAEQPEKERGSDGVDG
jgi:DNA-binding transcriptional ArsR family regulator